MLNLKGCHNARGAAVYMRWGGTPNLDEASLQVSRGCDAEPGLWSWKLKASMWKCISVNKEAVFFFVFFFPLFYFPSVPCKCDVVTGGISEIVPSRLSKWRWAGRIKPGSFVSKYSQCNLGNFVPSCLWYTLWLSPPVCDLHGNEHLL